MRVLHILNELRASGAEVMLARAAPLWREAGINSDVLATGDVLGEYAATLQNAGFVVHHLRFSPRVAYLRTLRRFIAEGRYDVVHVHPERAFFWVALAARTAGTRGIVRSVHNVFSFSGALRLERQVQRALLRRLGVVFVSVSASVQKNERKRFRNPTAHIRSWIDASSFRPPSRTERARARRNYGLQEDHLVLVTVGNCGHAKNHESVIEAISGLAHEDPIYLHAGEEQAGRPEYSVAGAMGVADRCRFIGRVENVRELLHAADIYVMPSYYEGLPIAALEAAATGLPCVLARVPGLSDLRGHVTEGAVWVTPDAASVVNGVRAAAALDREDVAWKMHGAIRSSFSVERGAREFAQLYRSLNDGR